MDPKWIEIVNQSAKNTKKGGKYEIVIITNLRNLKLGQGDELEKFSA